MIVNGTQITLTIGLETRILVSETRIETRIRNSDTRTRITRIRNSDTHDRNSDQNSDKLRIGTQRVTTRKEVYTRTFIWAKEVAEEVGPKSEEDFESFGLKEVG